MEPVKVDTKKMFFKEGFRPQILYVSPKLKVPLICMEPGQSIPTHPSGAGIFYVLEGSAVFTVGEEKKEVKAGSIVVAPQGVERGIEAKERLVVVAFHAG
ncbi:MAG TPA: cupin domain-containing protein [Thermodesulfobacteriota bacterium]|nr:cupin domain-containing protein [Thermodesulfobacteriota bacterium]